MTADKVKASGLRGKTGPPREKYHPSSVRVPAHMLAVVALAERSLDLERQVTSWKQALVAIERKLQAPSNVALSVQHNNLGNAGEERKCCEELEDAKERSGVAYVADSKSRDEAKTATQEVFMFEADYVAQAGRTRDEVSELTESFCQQVVSAAAGSKVLPAVHAKLETHKGSADFLDEVLKVSWKDVAAGRGIVQKKGPVWMLILRG